MKPSEEKSCTLTVEELQGLVDDHVQRGGAVVQAQADLLGQRLASGGRDHVPTEAEREQAEERESQRELVADRDPG